MNKRSLLFAAAVLAQCAILVAVPGRMIHARLTGQTIYLKTEPYDPYDILSGYYVRLNYNISRPSIDETDEWRRTVDRNKPVYVVLQKGEQDIWDAVAVHLAWPDAIDEGQVVIKGRYDRRRIRYGIETYYIPEKSREEIESDLRANARDATVEVKVSSYGHAALIRLVIDDRVYDY